MKIDSNTVYWNEDRTAYAVLISPSYGAGWSTWACCLALAYNREMVKFYLDHKGKIDEKDPRLVELATRIAGATPYFGGIHDMEVVWVKPGQKWQISEYDGSESLVILDENDWMYVEV